jgi:hypothetical protein
MPPDARTFDPRSDDGHLHAHSAGSVAQLVYELRDSRQTIALLLNVLDEPASTNATKLQATKALRHALHLVDVRLTLIEERMLEDDSVSVLRRWPDAKL